MEDYALTNLELTLAITALANAIAEDITDDGQLALLSAVLGQLSATLATISAQRSGAQTGIVAGA